jgi:hypothetical protein
LPCDLKSYLTVVGKEDVIPGSLKTAFYNLCQLNLIIHD